MLWDSIKVNVELLISDGSCILIFVRLGMGNYFHTYCVGVPVAGNGSTVAKNAWKRNNSY